MLNRQNMIFARKLSNLSMNANFGMWPISLVCNLSIFYMAKALLIIPSY